MEFQISKDFIYRTTGKRISERIEEKNISHRSIYERESKLIGRIRKGIAIKNRNPYLLRNDVQKALKDKLGFMTDNELLWGSETEIEGYSFLMFQSIMYDMISEGSDYIDETKDILCIDTSYAHWAAYEEIFSKPYFSTSTKYPIKEYYGIDDGDVVDALETATADAISYLFSFVQSSFKKSFLHFTEHTDSYKKLDRKLKEWIDQDILPMLEKYRPTQHSLNFRIKKLISEDFVYIPYISNNSAFSLSDTIILKELLLATEDYINSIEKIQEKLSNKKQHQLQMLLVD